MKRDLKPKIVAITVSATGKPGYAYHINVTDTFETYSVGSKALDDACVWAEAFAKRHGYTKPIKIV